MHLVQRFEANPLLRPADLTASTSGLKIECLLNPGAFRFQGKTWLLLRVAERPEQRDGRTAIPILDETSGGIRIREFDNCDPLLHFVDPRVITYANEGYLTTMSHLRLVASDDGIHFSPQPGYPPIFGHGDLETYGIEDCRVALIDSVYYLTFTQVSRHGVGVGLKSTEDWKKFQNLGMILPPHNKDCALFEQLINGKYYALHRPSSPELGGHYMWIAESEDLQHWGNHRCLAHPRAGYWDSKRIGAGASPIRTNEGWLEIYHGADSANRYCLGALLLDLYEPWKVIGRSHLPFMEPATEYERSGFLGNVIFTNGHVVDGDTITIYYGASDSVICGAQLSVAKLLDSVVEANARL